MPDNLTTEASTSESNPVLSKLHYVNVGPGGTFKPSGDPAYDSTTADVDKLFEYLRANDIKNIALYFHGGLTSLKDGLSTAEHFTSLANQSRKVHPVSFLWETGMMETLKENLSTIHSNDLFKKLLEKVIKVAGEKLGIDLESGTGRRGVASLSKQEINEELNTEAPFEDYSVDPSARSATVQNYNEDILKAEVEEELEIEVEMDETLQEELRKEKSSDEIKFLNTSQLNDQQTEGARGIFQTIKLVKSLATVVINVIRRHINKRDHGFFPTIVEELMRELYVASVGSWIWASMKKKAASMWLDDSPGASNPDRHAGTYFMDQLSLYTKDRNDVSIDLIGHSAGSIVICHFMQRLVTQPYSLPLRNIIFMAPACTSSLFNAAIVANESLFKNFRMFTMEDRYEQKDRLLPYVYTRSLLYLVSGALEDEGKSFDAYILGMQRYLHDTPPFDSDPVLGAIRNFFKATENRVIYSKTADDALAGLISTSLKHGDFDNRGEKTMESIIHILNQ